MKVDKMALNYIQFRVLCEENWVV